MTSGPPLTRSVHAKCPVPCSSTATSGVAALSCGATVIGFGIAAEARRGERATAAAGVSATASTTAHAIPAASPARPTACIRSGCPDIRAMPRILSASGAVGKGEPPARSPC